MALQALSTFAAAVGSHDLDLTITVTSDAAAAVVASFNIHQDNYLVRQSQQVGHRVAPTGRHSSRRCV